MTVRELFLQSLHELCVRLAMTVSASDADDSEEVLLGTALGIYDLEQRLRATFMQWIEEKKQEV